MHFILKRIISFAVTVKIVPLLIYSLLYANTISPHGTDGIGLLKITMNAASQNLQMDGRVPVEL